MWGRLWCTPNSFASDPSRVPPAWACGARAPIRVPDPVEGPAPLGVAPRHTRASLHGRNDYRVVRSSVVVLGPLWDPRVSGLLLAAVRGRAHGAERPLLAPGPRARGGRSRPGAARADVRRGAHAWIGEAGDVSSLN